MIETIRCLDPFGTWTTWWIATKCEDRGNSTLLVTGEDGINFATSRTHAGQMRHCRNGCAFRDLSSDANGSIPGTTTCTVGDAYEIRVLPR